MAASLRTAAKGLGGQTWFQRAVEHSKLACKAGLVNPDVPSALFMDGERLNARVQDLHNAFNGDHFVHTFAMKANPTMRVLEALGKAGMGLESASIGELSQALRVDKSIIPSSRIVYDTPVKTVKDTLLALTNDVHMNVDNMFELDRLVGLIAENPSLVEEREHGHLGVRINPQVGAGTIAAFSTAGTTSKFGVGLEDHREDLIQAYQNHRWLTMLHCHVGSQGVAPELAAAGIRKIIDFAKEINRRVGRQQVTVLDIGGGLTVNFASEEDTPSFADLADVYGSLLPELFTGDFTVLTEFGRAIAAKAGFALSRVEFTKVTGGRHIALQHVGVDLAIRTVYHPDIWPLRITVLDSEGNERTGGETAEYDVAGPCCIQGDIIAHQRELPVMEAGDWLMVHDVGGYYLSSFSTYNMRQAPPMYGYGFAPFDSSEDTFQLLQRGQSPDDTCDMFHH